MGFKAIGTVGKQLVTQKDALRGLMTIDGKSIISEMSKRKDKLETVQVYQMLSKLEQGKQQNLFTIKARYHKKMIHADTLEEVQVYTGKHNGYDIELLDTSENTINFIEAAARPAVPGHIMAHLARLAMHKPIGGKDDALRVSIVLEDLSIGLFGCSEFAIAQTCDEFKKCAETDFFPNYGKFIKRCEELTEQYATLYKKSQDMKQIENQTKT